jgi:nitrate reductase beta subunit
LLAEPAAASTEEHPCASRRASRRDRDALRQHHLHRLQSLYAGVQRSQRPAADTLLSGGIWDMPTGLNAQTKNIIELYQDPKSDEFAFVKKQCMHCLDPACVTGCPFGSLKKVDFGAVTWNSSLCIGCRYCEVACPFEVPQFQWEAWNPKIVKCEFCYDQRLKRIWNPPAPPPAQPVR